MSPSSSGRGGMVVDEVEELRLSLKIAEEAYLRTTLKALRTVRTAAKALCCNSGDSKREAIISAR